MDKFILVTSRQFYELNVASFLTMIIYGLFTKHLGMIAVGYLMVKLT